MNFVGLKVVKVRRMTSRESRKEGWDNRGQRVIEFDDGTIVYASQDDEGNGPGTLFARDAKGAGFYVTEET